MVAAVVCVVLLPFLFFASDCHAQDTQEILLKVVNSIERLIGFYKASYQYMNLDGIYGLKVVEGQIQRILDEHKQGLHATLNPTIVQRLSAILHDAKWIGEQAISAVRADDETYFQNLAYVISQPWTHLKRHRKVVPASRWDISVYESSKNMILGEQESDKCMMEITMSDKVKTRGSQTQCSLTKDCAKTMTARGLTDYGITHQLLWTALAEKAGCGKEIDVLMKTLGFNSTDQMQEEFCTNNYYEMLTVVHIFMSGKVSNNYQDMFMEQQFVCPSLGFFEFLKKEYLEQILSWQLPTGCFGEEEDTDSAPQEQVHLKLPPNLDLSELGSLVKLKNPSKISDLDMKKQQMQEKLKNLKSSNPFLQAMVQKEREGGSQMAQLHQQLQKLNQMRNIPPRNDVLRNQRSGNVLGPQMAVNQEQRGVPHVKVIDLHHQHAQESYRQHQPPFYDHGVDPVDAVNRAQAHFQPDIQPRFVNGYHNAEAVRSQDNDHETVNINPPAHRLKDILPVLSQGNFLNQQPDNIPIRPPADAAYNNARLQDHILESLSRRRLDQESRQINSDDDRLAGHLGNDVELQQDVLDRFQGLDAQAMQKALREGVDAFPHYPGHVQSGEHRKQFPSLQDRLNGGFPGRRILSTYETGQGSQRKLLVEKEMPGGCLAHKTGVASGALAMYLRYLIDPGPLDLFVPHKFYPDSPQGFLGDKDSYRKIMDFIRNRFAKSFNDDNILEDEHVLLGLGGKGDEGGEEDGGDDEEEERENREYREKDELYPDAGMEDKQGQVKKVVRFGANGDDVHRVRNKEDYNYVKEDEKDEYVNDKEEELDDDGDKEEGPDYIKRVKGEDNKGAHIAGKGSNKDEDTEYTYYDDSDNTERGIISKHKPQAPAQESGKIHAHDRHKPQPPVVIAGNSVIGQPTDTPPSKMLVMLLSATSIVLLLFMCRFMRKRRIHVKLGNRAFLKL